MAISWPGRAGERTGGGLVAGVCIILAAVVLVVLAVGAAISEASCQAVCRNTCWTSQTAGTELCGAVTSCFSDCISRSGLDAADQATAVCVNVTMRARGVCDYDCNTACAQEARRDDAMESNTECIQQERCAELQAEWDEALLACRRRECPSGGLVSWKAFLAIAVLAGFGLPALAACACACFTEALRAPTGPEDCSLAPVVGRAAWAIGVFLATLAGGMGVLPVYLAMTTGPPDAGSLFFAAGIYLSIGYWSFLMTAGACVLVALARCCLAGEVVQAKGEADEEEDPSVGLLRRP